MNTAQRIALVFAVTNLLLLLLFPPYDYISLERGGIATFDGFYFAFGSHQNRIANANFLALEVIVVLINAGIAVLLLRDSPIRQRQRPGQSSAKNGTSAGGDQLSVDTFVSAIRIFLGNHQSRLAYF